MNEILENAGTVFFVSHSLDEITRLCNRALWLVHGQLREDGAPTAVVRSYIDWIDEVGADHQSTQQALRYRSRRQERRKGH